MDLDNIAANGVGGGAAQPAAQAGVGGFLFGGAGEMTVAIFSSSRLY